MWKDPEPLSKHKGFKLKLETLERLAKLSLALNIPMALIVKEAVEKYLVELENLKPPA